MANEIVTAIKDSSSNTHAIGVVMTNVDGLVTALDSKAAVSSVPTSYIKSAVVTNSNLELTDQGGTVITFTGGGGSYTLPTATSAVLGGVKSSTTGTATGRDYNVEVNSDGTMKVNVPWSGVASAVTLDDLPDGSTRSLANYLPLTGGTITGNTGLYIKYIEAAEENLKIHCTSNTGYITGKFTNGLHLQSLSDSIYSDAHFYPGTSNTYNLGATNQYWKNIYSSKFIIPNGTANQYLRADGTVSDFHVTTMPTVTVGAVKQYVGEDGTYTCGQVYVGTAQVWAHASDGHDIDTDLTTATGNKYSTLLSNNLITSESTSVTFGYVAGSWKSGITDQTTNAEMIANLFNLASSSDVNTSYTYSLTNLNSTAASYWKPRFELAE